MQKLNKELKKYIEKEILPTYYSFDTGHNQNHILDTTKRALYLYKQLSKENDLNINMVYTIAMYHDIGMKVQRENHSYYSKQILLQDENLKKWFSNEEIVVMADAVEDHSTSRQSLPRTIYGKIISDADKDYDVDKGILRGYGFSLKHNPQYSISEHIDNVHAEMIHRFADEDIGGAHLVEFYFPNKYTKAFYNEMKAYAYDKKLFEKKIKKLIKHKA